MLKYFAIFHVAEEGGYNVEFPDLECGYTQGKNLDEALDMAVDLLSGVLAVGRKGRDYSDPSGYEAILAQANQGAGDLVFPVVPSERVMAEYRPKKRVNVMLPEKQLEAIAGIVDGAAGLDRSKFITRAIDYYLAEKYPDTAREAVPEAEEA